MVTYFRRGFGAIVMTGRSDHLAIMIAAGAAGDRDLGDRDSESGSESVQRLQFQVPPPRTRNAQWLLTVGGIPGMRGGCGMGGAASDRDSDGDHQAAFKSQRCPARATGSHGGSEPGR